MGATAVPTTRLEDEAITIIREIAAECERPVLLFSGGKDSVVMLHLAQRAFFPARIPFPVMHVDTGWKFREMIEFRDRRAAELGLDLRIAQNLEAIDLWKLQVEQDQLGVVVGVAIDMRAGAEEEI